MRDLELTAVVTYAAHSEAARAAHRDARHRPIDVPVRDRGAARDACWGARIVSPRFRLDLGHMPKHPA
jgi:hypothetical protein